VSAIGKNRSEIPKIFRSHTSRFDAAYQFELERLGLSEIEAQIYLTLLKRGGAWKAAAIAATLQTARSTAYEAINSLRERGLLEAEVGYGGRLSAVPAEHALPHLIAADQEELLQRQQELSQRKQVASELAEELKAISSPVVADAGDSKLVEVIRDPRVCSVRLQQLQETAEHEVDALVKAPLVLKAMTQQGNPAETESLKRGVTHRAIYESKVLEDPGVARHLPVWIKAGEQARIHEGELPFKFALFDNKIAWVALQVEGARNQIVSVLIRHPDLGRALRLLFDYLWRESEPFNATKHAPKDVLSLQQPPNAPRLNTTNGGPRSRRKKQISP
jgi:sugar-specific transcriptional regulator TrmB